MRIGMCAAQGGLVVVGWEGQVEGQVGDIQKNGVGTFPEPIFTMTAIKSFVANSMWNRRPQFFAHVSSRTNVFISVARDTSSRQWARMQARKRDPKGVRQSHLESRSHDRHSL